VNEKIEAKINLPYSEIRAFCQRQSIRKLSLFGSVLRDDFGPNSDVDMLVEYETGARIGYFEVIAMQDELTDIIGQHVDLRTPQELSQYFRNRVLDTAVLLYERN